ncbi:MAG: hypothetical protein JWQ54_5774 [Mucilaginibacter sp.]|nr:hypothetical protein [Mucilaginibacter sp.]
MAGLSMAGHSYPAVFDHSGKNDKRGKPVGGRGHDEFVILINTQAWTRWFCNIYN